MFESLEHLCKELNSLPREREKYAQALGKVCFGIDEVKQYCHFSKDFYTRNLVARTDDFELVVLCWEPARISPIHDHSNSDGWVRGMRGTIEEIWYQYKKHANGTLSVTKGRVAQLGVGALTYINDNIAWHTVGNPGDTRAVTLHCYSPPIDACQYYDPQTRTAKLRTLSYYSDKGILS